MWNDDAAWRRRRRSYSLAGVCPSLVSLLVLHSLLLVGTKQSSLLLLPLPFTASLADYYKNNNKVRKNDIILKEEVTRQRSNLTTETTAVPVMIGVPLWIICLWTRQFTPLVIALLLLGLPYCARLWNHHYHLLQRKHSAPLCGFCVATYHVNLIVPIKSHRWLRFLGGTGIKTVPIFFSRHQDSWYQKISLSVWGSSLR